MNDSIFSRYSQGENRVTASILAVLRSLALHRVERILAALLEQDFNLVRFKNQPSRGGKGVPDAEIIASCCLLLETKVKRNAIKNKIQIEQHLRRLDGQHEDQRFLLVLTPDDAPPQHVDEIADDRLLWASFAALDQAIDELLADKEEVVSEREAFLLRELQKMLVQEGLLGSTADTVVVAARHAWSHYERCYAYLCQQGRSFQPVKYVAFYRSNRIEALVPRIQKIHDDVLLGSATHKGRLAEVVEAYLRICPKWAGGFRKVFILSPPDDKSTLKLEKPIRNDLKSAKGRTIAFTQGQRYVSAENLLNAETTAEVLSE